MIKNPELVEKPLGIQQKNIIVTCNYVARSFGIKKCMLVVDGLKLCPGLVLVKGEDLQPYRHMSKNIFSLLQTFKCPVEKLGMDENFIDVTSLVKNEGGDGVVGHLFDEYDVNECDCGCEKRLSAASRIAQRIRQALKDELNITTCAGIAHNKLLAKLIGSTHKPNQQTTIYPASGCYFLSQLDSVQSIPGIGVKTAETLNSLGLVTVLDLQNCDINLLNNTFSADVALKLKRLSLGIDNSEVKMSSKPLSLGLEDSFKIISVESEVKEKLETLLTRLLVLLENDGRKPTGIKVTLRRQMQPKPVTHRETRHCSVSPSLFQFKDGSLVVVESSRRKLMSMIMKLFYKLVDLSKPFHITLLGLAFTKFQEMITGKGSIANYFMNDLSVQSILNLQSDTDSSVTSMDCSGLTDTTLSEKSESETEPSPKKVRFTGIRRHLRQSSPSPSPSKLRVADLHLNACDAVSLLRLSPKEMDSDSSKSVSPEWSGVPNDIDLEVFNALPSSLQQDLRSSWKRNVPNGSSFCDIPVNNDKGNTITRYFIPNKR